MIASLRARPHSFVPYPKGSLYFQRKHCVRCGLHENNPVHIAEKKEEEK